jgi:siroheme decarboxylase
MSRQPPSSRIAELGPFEQRLLDEYQHALPLVPRPFAAIAAELEVDEDVVIQSLARLQEHGAVSRVGVTLRPNAVGAGTLAAMAVPEAELERVAGIIDAFAEVNHNYERENALNLWFVVTAPSELALETVLMRIEAATGYPLLAFPMLEDYRLDLGFSLQW